MATFLSTYTDINLIVCTFIDASPGLHGPYSRLYSRLLASWEASVEAKELSGLADALREASNLNLKIAEVFIVSGGFVAGSPVLCSISRSQVR